MTLVLSTAQSSLVETMLPIFFVLLAPCCYSLPIDKKPEATYPLDLEHNEIDHTIQQQASSTRKKMGGTKLDPYHGMHEAGPSHTQPSPPCRLVSFIPDSLSSVERKILDDQKQHNLKMRILKQEWSKARPKDSNQELREYQQHADTANRFRWDELNSSLDETVRRARLQNRKQELIDQYKRLRDFFTYSEPSMPNRFDAGPQNGESDKPDRSGVSPRQFMAELESVTINRCNQMNELRLEIERITRELEGKKSEPAQMFINWKGDPHTWL